MNEEKAIKILAKFIRDGASPQSVKNRAHELTITMPGWVEASDLEIKARNRAVFAF
jgi:hypothetical protein